VSERNKIEKPDENRDQPPKKTKFAIKIITRGACIRLAILAALLAVIYLWTYATMTKMPGKSYSSPLPTLTDDQIALRNQLASDVQKLAADIGQRNIWNHWNLIAAANFLEASLTDAGYTPRRQDYIVEGQTCCNIEAEHTGTKNPDQIIIIGAHYDTVLGSPGANDNASAVAAALALARRFANKKTDKTIRFLFFPNEEAPFFHTEQMGSYVYANTCRQKNENIVAMLSLETIGYYTDRPKTQKYPPPFSLFYPSTANFLGFVSDSASKKLLHAVIASFRKNCKFPSQGGAIPEIVPGINWSDHWSFWRNGYPAIMITDTAPFRYPHYHTPDDTPDKIDYDSLARVTSGLEKVITELATTAQE
jgi:Zn-dependent M28 family amino/carboxypeptidase